MNMEQKISKSAQIVQDALAKQGLNFKVLELPSSTRTAQEAAATIGCQIAQIVKSLVFKTKETNKPVLILASGTNRVDEKCIEKILEEKLIRADAEFVREVTGFAIGGVPPIGHKTSLTTFIDEDLLQYTDLWAAAGTPNAVFSFPANKLQVMTNGKVIAVH